MPVLQLSEAEDAYAPRRATFGSQFQSPSLGLSGARDAKQKAHNINSLSSIHPLIHYYINASTVILSQLTYYINIPTYIPLEVGHEAIQRNVKTKTIEAAPNNIT